MKLFKPLHKIHTKIEIAKLQKVVNDYLENEPKPTPRHFRNSMGFTKDKWHYWKEKYASRWKVLNDTQDIILARIEQVAIYNKQANPTSAIFILKSYDRERYIIETNNSIDSEATNKYIIKLVNNSKTTLRKKKEKLPWK